MENTPRNGDGGIERLLSAVVLQMLSIETKVGEIHEMLASQQARKAWYTTTEVAEKMGVSVYTVRVRWCAGARIRAKKDFETRQWRISGEEFERLRRGGGLLPRGSESEVVGNED